MSIMKLRESIERMVPINEQEEKDKKRILQYLTIPDIFERENEVMHFTASGWVVNSTRDKVLMCYHKIYDSWAWLGGHADGEQDLLGVAMREVREESGLQNICPVSDEILSVEILTVDGHVKKGRYVSSHLHLNVTYLIEADEEEPLTVNESENKGLQWFGLEEAIAASTEPWFQEHIYTKLNQKLRKMTEQ